MQWLGLSWDEGPVYQSQRLDVYKKAAEILLESGNAYHCFCTPERLAQMRKEQEERREPPRYDQTCLALSKDEVAKALQASRPYVVRMKVPQQGVTVLEDIVRGKVTFQNALLDDQVLIKSDGFPTYHLAVVVDDHDMGVTHVIRAEEWLSSTPKHLLVYQFLGWSPPQFAHLPIIVGADRSKLSKRHGAESVLTYREQGYLPEALVNFLALLGWAPAESDSAPADNREVFTLDELSQSFSLERVQKSPAFFDRNKLDWFNGHYIRTLPASRVLEALKPFVPPEWEAGLVENVLPLVRDRMITLADFKILADFFFEDVVVERRLLKLEGVADVKQVLQDAVSTLKECQWEHDALEQAMRALADRYHLKHGELFMLLRVAVTGRTATPPLFDTMLVLGRDTVLSHLQSAIDTVGDR